MVLVVNGRDLEHMQAGLGQPKRTVGDEYLEAQGSSSQPELYSLPSYRLAKSN